MSDLTNNPLDNAKRAVVRVGNGRGFVIDGGFGAFVVTAAHCLPFIPPCESFFYTEERTYKALLGPLGEVPTVWAECLFADPVGDIAVLGRPDDQFKDYIALMRTCSALNISDAPNGVEVPARLLTLNGEWFRCVVQPMDRSWWIRGATEGIVGGMSGSPILADDWSAIGIVCCAGGSGPDTEKYTEGGPNPRLAYNLPGWLSRQVRMSRKRRSNR